MINLNLHMSRGVRQLAVPECWDELTPAQMVRIAGIVFEEEDPDRRDVAIAMTLCDLTRAQLLDITAEVLALELVQLFGWVTESCDRTEAFLPPLEIGGLKFYGPTG